MKRGSSGKYDLGNADTYGQVFPSPMKREVAERVLSGKLTGQGIDTNQRSYKGFRVLETGVDGDVTNSN